MVHLRTITKTRARGGRSDERQELRFAGSVPARLRALMVPLIFQPYADELARRAREPCRQGGSSKRRRGPASSPGRCTRPCPTPRSSRPISISRCSMSRSERAAFRQRPVPAGRRAGPAVRGRQASTWSSASSARCFFRTRCAAMPKRAACFATAEVTCSRSGTASNATLLTEVAQQVLIDTFPDDPPLFMREGPFGYADTDRIEADLHRSWFRNGRNRNRRAEEPQRVRARCGSGAMLRNADGCRARRTCARQPRTSVRRRGAGARAL